MIFFKLQQNSVNQIFNQKAFFFVLLTGDNDITMPYTLYLLILHHLQAIHRTFSVFFTIFCYTYF